MTLPIDLSGWTDKAIDRELVLINDRISDLERQLRQNREDQYCLMKEEEKRNKKNAPIK